MRMSRTKIGPSSATIAFREDEQKIIEKRNMWMHISLKTEGKISVLNQNGYVSTGPKYFSTMLKKHSYPEAFTC